MVLNPPDENILEVITERIGFDDELEEMVNLKKAITGLPVNIYADDTRSYIVRKHAKQIMFQGDYGNNTNRNNMFSMMLSKDNPEIPKDQKPRVKLPAKDINAIKSFVIVNVDLLSQLADEKIGIDIFLKQMKKYEG